MEYCIVYKLSDGINKDNFHLICRTCLVSTKHTFPITVPEFIQMINQSASVQEELQKKLPQQVCSSCYSQLKIFQHFMEQCRKATEILTNVILQNECKIEPVKDIVDIPEEIVCIKNETGSLDKTTLTDDEYEDTVKNSDNYNENEEIKVKKTEENINKDKHSELIKLLTSGVNSNSEQNGVTTTTTPAAAAINSDFSTEVDLFYEFAKAAKKVREKRDKNTQCNICNAKFKYPSLLEAHKSKHTTVRPYKCKLCERSYKNYSGLYMHEELVHNKSFPKTLCHICGQFVPAHLLKSHIGKKHYKVKNFVAATCEICNKKYTSKYSYNLHMRQQHDETYNNFAKPCSKCSRVFRTYGALRYHMLNVHMKVKNHACHICNRRFYKNCQLKMHINIQHLDIRPFECTECNERFHTKPVLNNHMTRHTGERRFLCTYCGQRFNFHGALYTHIKLKHKKEKNGMKLIDSTDAK